MEIGIDSFAAMFSKNSSRDLNDADAMAAAIDDNTVAVLLEPIQGEAGIIVPRPDRCVSR